MRLTHVHVIVKWLEEFEKVRVLGVGGTGIVYELLHKTNGKRYAMKEMEIKNKLQMQMAVSEAEMLKDIMENISHPNIMHIEKVFQVGSKFYLVFPLCTGGELYEHIVRRGHFTEHDAAVIFRDIISGLHALHEHDILHLDIKPENILFDSLGDDARIKITDFGLAKLFKNVQDGSRKDSDDNRSVVGCGFSESLMKERLKAFAESGDLNKDRLRGTVGYMSPELILMGHTSKATDVFAAGVVLYILLCGRPPFHSKSNREVLEKTARGTFFITGGEWDAISEEAKDLVKRMLVSNPDSRITTGQILSHPWLAGLDAEPEADASVPVPVGGSVMSGPSLTRKGSSSVNLAGALRQLSGHVKYMRSEKLASNVTNLMTLLQHKNDSSLANQYLSSPSQPSSSVAKKSLLGNIDEESEHSDVDMDHIFMDSVYRTALSRAIEHIDEKYNSSCPGKFTIEQFLLLLKHFAFNNASSSSYSEHSHGESGQGHKGQNMTLQNSFGGLLFCKFIDRDQDGYISVDDIFNAQALIMQRSELYLKTIFRLYVESVWYPGRQLNVMNLVNSIPMRGSNSHTTNTAGADSNNNNMFEDKNIFQDIVEPPKFITGRHISAVFERLGYEASKGAEVFGILCEALNRIRVANAQSPEDACLSPSDKSSEASNDHKPSGDAPNIRLAAALEEFESASLPMKYGSTVNTPTRGGSSTATSLPPPPVTTNAANNAATTAKMDFSDFVRAVEMDDVLLQVFLRRKRRKFHEIIQSAKLKKRLSGCKTSSLSSQSTDENGEQDRCGVEELSAVMEETIKEAFKSLRVSDSGAMAAVFPVASAVGRATLSAAYGLAMGAQLLIDATYEVMADDSDAVAAAQQSQLLQQQRL